MKFKIKENGSLKEIANYVLNNYNNKIILLDGDLGTGKTTFVKAIAKEINDSFHVVSPTFNKMNIYQKIIHLDAYNIKGSLESYEDYFDNKMILIEWGKNIIDSNFEYFQINITIDQNRNRIFEMKM